MDLNQVIYGEQTERNLQERLREAEVEIAERFVHNPIFSQATEDFRDIFSLRLAVMSNYDSGLYAKDERVPRMSRLAFRNLFIGAYNSTLGRLFSYIRTK